DRYPPSFPTRRSSDLVQVRAGSKQDKIEHSIRIDRKEGSPVEIKYLLDCDYATLVNVLQGAHSGFDEFQDEKQLVPIDEMEEPRSEEHTSELQSRENL